MSTLAMKATLQHPLQVEPMSSAIFTSARCVARSGLRAVTGGLSGLFLILGAGFTMVAHAEDTVCARVKIEIKQELTLERQAFDAEMKINNTTTDGVIENVSVVVKVTEEDGTPVAISDDPNNIGAKFFIRISNKQSISNVDGTGTVNPASTAIIDWLVIPAPGSAGPNPLGKKYLVGATLKYRFGGEDQTLDVSPDVITVKPLPLLTLDYFLTQDVLADEPLTPEIEPVVPFTLGVRIKNNGYTTAKNLKIDSAQPKIIENNQGLLINFMLTGSYVDDAPVQNTLLVNFGDIPANTSKIGRWIMETTLAGKFTEFTARFSHADELGGTLTSILQATNAHLLIRDVRVDLPGRDYVRDFLAQDGDVIRVYESDGQDTLVTDRSGVAQLTASTNAAGNAVYHLVIPPTAGFIYVKLPDPFNGQKALGQIVRSDAKVMLPENVWLSKTRNEQTKQWTYWVNFFDVNTTGIYDAEFQAPPAGNRPPVIQFIPDRVTKEEKQVSFLVEASSPDGKPVTISAAPLPTGAKFTMQAVDPQAPTLVRAVFDWTPLKGTAGSYLIVYAASDGTLSVTRSAAIKVDTASPPPGPGTPTIDSPASGAQVASLMPTLSVLTSANPQDPTVKVQFEVYKDEAMAQLVESALVDKAAAAAGNGAGPVQPTAWQPAANLDDNTAYWWRARAFDGTQTYSSWANGRLFVNLYNDPPDSFNLTSPAPDMEVAELQPVLSWTNAADKDGDVVTYGVTLYRDATLTDVVTSAGGLSAGTGGLSSWTVDATLTNHSRYYWKVIANDVLGAQTPSIARSFVVNTGNTAPSAPVIASPAIGGQSTSPSTVLTIQNSIDAENDLITYVFEIDMVNTFDSSDKRSSGQVIQSASAVTAWMAAGLIENKRYYWRVKAQDGRAESIWAAGDFLMNALNDAPPMPTVKNPGNAAWIAIQQPSLEANPVLDPEGEAVRYQFEVYRDVLLATKAADGISTNTGWIVSAPLADKTTHWWRVRALDTHDAASPWSPATILYVSTAPYQDPTIQVTSPAIPVTPDVVSTPTGNHKRATIRWEGTDPNIEPNLALYYGTDKTGYAGNLIVDGLRQTAGTQSGSYVWDVTDFAPGAYYVYGVIYDAKGVGRAYAPGAVVVPPATQSGKILVTLGGHSQSSDNGRQFSDSGRGSASGGGGSRASGSSAAGSAGSSGGSRTVTSEDGKKTTFTVRLGNAPTGDVVVPVSSTSPREGIAEPASLTFTRQNWMANQTVTVTGQEDCAPDGKKAYQVLTGKAVTIDPNYIGLSGMPVSVTNKDDQDKKRTTNNANIHICGLTVASERKVNTRTWEYTLKAELTNTGGNVSGVLAKLRELPFDTQLVDDAMQFGAVNQGETAKSIDAVTVRTRFPVPMEIFKRGIGFRWSVTVQP